MKFVFFIFSAVINMAFMNASIAQETDQEEDYSELLAQHRFEISMRSDALSGPGADWLADRMAENHFFIFGEQHATKEIAQAGILMFEMAISSGYKNAAIEVGRWGTDLIEGIIRKEGMEGYNNYLAEDMNLMTVPFYFFREEAPLLGAAISAGGNAPSLWGLDQEFIASSVPLLSQLLGFSETEEEQAAVNALLEQARQVPFLIGGAPPEVFMGLKQVFKDSSSEPAREIVDEIIITNRIYGPFTGRGGSGYLANDERESFMKTNFARYMKNHKEKYGEIPKVFMKFGASHGSKGLSITKVYALGNFVMEYGNLEGLGTYNIHVDCLSGNQLNVQTGGPTPCVSYFLNQESPFQINAFSEGMTLFDLKSLRSETAFLKTLDEKSKTLVYAYDALLIIRNTTPASLLPGTVPDFGQ